MNDLRGPAEARLLHVERALEQLQRDLRNDQRKLIAVGQAVWALWGDVGGIAGTPAPITATVTGAPVSGCSGVQSGVTVTITNHATSAVLATAMTDGSGNFSATFPLSMSTSVDITFSGTNWVTQTVNTTLSPGGSYATGAITLSPASGYATSDFPTICACLPWTFTLVDSVYGSTTLTYDPANGWWIGCRTVSYPGTVNCPSGSIALQYTLTGSAFAANWNMVVNWAGHVVSGHSCPLPGATCSSSLNFSRGPVSSSPTMACSGTYTWSFGTAANSPWPSTGGATLTITF